MHYVQGERYSNEQYERNSKKKVKITIKSDKIGKKDISAAWTTW